MNEMTLPHLGKRTITAAFGLFLFAVGIYAQMVAGMGTSPWNVLNDGLAHLVHISFGQASIILSFVIVIADVVLGEPIGVGTLLDVFLTGTCVDFLSWLDPLPVPHSLLTKILIVIVSMLITSFGQYLYMGAGMSCGPRDALLVAIGKRLPKLSIGLVSIGLMCLVTVAGALLGGLTGLGTILTMFGMGICMDLVFHLMHFEPRVIHQEGLRETWADFKTALTQTQGES